MDLKNQFSAFKRLKNLLSLDSKEIVQIYGFAVLIGVLTLSLPLGIQSIINFIQAGRFSSSWIILVVLVILATAMIGVMQAFQLRITENIQQKTFARASFDFAYRIPKFKMNQLGDKYAPELINRFFDTLTLQKGMSKLFLDISTSAIQICFALILLSLYHPVFIFFSFLLVLFLYLIFKFSGKKGMETSLYESKYKYQVVHWLEEVARNMNTFKLAGNTKLHINKTDDMVNNYLKYRESHFKVLMFQYLNLIGFKVFVIAGLLIVGGVLVIQQKINLGQFVASEIIILLIMSNVEKLVIGLDTVYDVLTAVEKIGQVTDIELESNEGIKINNEASCENLSVEVKDLSFNYPHNQTLALNNVSFKIPSGKKVCISGFNQSGKSTLLSLINGIYSPNKGNVFFNDIGINNLDLQNFRSNIGGMISNEDLFHGSVMENITVGREKITQQQVLWAVEMIGLSDVIKNLPKGYETIISPEAKEFSKSTIKKILLARSIVTKPKLLLLENTFEYFEKSTKIQLINFLTDASNGWTMLLISNDPEIAKKCDEVIVLKNGEIQHKGTFDEIIQKNEIKDLYNA